MLPVELLIAFLGGVCPALVWLFFWLMEDRCQPEPKRYIIFSFFAGMLAVVPALALEKWAVGVFAGVGLLAAWAAIEELLKYAAAYVSALSQAVFDEPLDAIVYLTTAALGFSAFENALFLWDPVTHSDLLRGIVTEDLRFMGASLLHVLSSATIGLSLALSFYKPAPTRKLYALVGVVLAISLHTIFNFLILGEGTGATLWIFLSLWVGVVAMLVMVEKIKQPKDYC